MSTPLIVREFSLTRDFRKIRWGATLWYNILRAIAAGLIIGILMFMFPKQQGDQMTALSGPFIWPIAYLFFFLPFGMFLGVVGQFIPVVNLVGMFVALMAVTVGDPLVCIIHKFWPKAVPVAAPPLFSFSLINWVLDTDTEISIAN